MAPTGAHDNENSESGGVGTLFWNGSTSLTGNPHSFSSLSLLTKYDLYAVTKGAEPWHVS